MTANWFPKTMSAEGTICPNLTMNDNSTETWWVPILRAWQQLTDIRDLTSHQQETHSNWETQKTSCLAAAKVPASTKKGLYIVVKTKTIISEVKSSKSKWLYKLCPLRRQIFGRVHRLVNQWLERIKENLLVILRHFSKRQPKEKVLHVAGPHFCTVTVYQTTRKGLVQTNSFSAFLLWLDPRRWWHVVTNNREDCVPRRII